jgi:hypothetical protein
MSATMMRIRSFWSCLETSSRSSQAAAAATSAGTSRTRRVAVAFLGLSLDLWILVVTNRVVLHLDLARLVSGPGLVGIFRAITRLWIWTH